MDWTGKSDASQGVRSPLIVEARSRAQLEAPRHKPKYLKSESSKQTISENIFYSAT